VLTQTEVALLLALANGHDQRQGIDDVRVQAWWDLFRQEAPDMTSEFAKEAINRHYALMTDMLMPAHLVTAWKYYKSRKKDQAALPAKGVPMPDWFKEKVKGQSWE
jgi:hypothetical protein